MFTGIIETTGSVLAARDVERGRRLVIDAGGLPLSSLMGASIAINGCCTTIVELEQHSFHVELMPITLDRTNLGLLQQGDTVNLERPLRLGDELGGHLVQGHIEGVGTVTAMVPDGENWKLTVRVPDELVNYIVKTGSIAVDGISLTVAEISGNLITIGIIPHTWEVTVVAGYRPGSRVNIETDMFAKYVEKIMSAVSSANTTPQKTGDQEDHAR